MRDLKISLLFSILASLGCTREATGPTTVTFRLPAKSALMKNVVSQSATGISDFDCLGVFVSAPGDTANTCTMNNGVSFKTGRPYGPYVFLNSTSQEISLSVPSGDSRVIRVMGFSTSTGACLDFGDDVDDPHVIAESSPTTLVPGKNQVLEMTMAFDSGKALDSCEGADFNGGGGGGYNGPYLRVEGLYNYDVGENPAAKLLTRGVCYPVSFMPYEPCNGGGVCTPKTPATDLVVTLANNDVKFFGAKSACETNSAPLLSVTMTGGVSPGTQVAPVYTAFMRVPLNKVNVVTTDLSSEVSVPAGHEIQFTQPDYSYFNIGKPVVRASGLLPNVGNYYSASEIPLSSCATNTTTFHFYPAGSTSPEWVPANELISHEYFAGVSSGLRFFDNCGGTDTGVSNTLGSVTGWFKQNTTLGATGGEVTKAIKLAQGAHAGKWILVGGFGTFAGQTVSGPIKRVFHNGVEDVTFKALNVDGAIYDVIEQPDGALIIAGDFSNVGGQARRGLARILSDGNLDTTFTLVLNGAGLAKTLALSGTTVFVGGEFTTIGGLSRVRLAAFDYATQTVLSWAPNPNNLVTDILADPSANALFVGGYFTMTSSTGRNYLASYALSTLTLTAWNPSPSGFVFSLSSAPTLYTLLVGGNFTMIAGQSRNQVASFTGGTSSPTIAGLNVTDQTFAGPVHSIVRNGSFFYIGGDLGGSGSVIRVLLEGTAADSTFDPAVAGTVKHMVVDTGDLLLFGSMTLVDGASVNGYSALDIATSGQPRSFAVMNPLRSIYSFNPALFDTTPFMTFGH